MNLPFRFYAFVLMFAATTSSLLGCASQGKPPPTISLDEPVQAQPLPEPPKPVEVLAVPEPLALPAQLKPLPEMDEAAPVPEPTDRREGARLARQRRGAHGAHARRLRQRDPGVAFHRWRAVSGLYRAGARHRGFAPARRGTGHCRRRRYRALDCRRHVQRQRRGAARERASQAHPLGPENQSGHHHQPPHLPAGTDLDGKGMEASVSWDYPKDRMLALQRQSQAAQTAAPVDTGLALEKIRFRYAISGSNPPWKPQRAFDDGEKVYIQFPPGIAQGELPPLFVIGAQGDGQLVNYRFRSPYYIVDRLFGAAELRLGGDGGDVVRIERTDGVARRN